VKHPHLFEISAWPWLERLSVQENRRVTLNDVPPREWDAIAARGFAYLFLMGVWQRSTVGRDLALADSGLRAEYDRALPGWTPADVCGSPYCVAAYEPDARMGGRAGLATARAELNRRGVRLVLDFVPNHTAFDYRWVREHPHRYVLGSEEDVRNSPADFRRIGDTIVACARNPYFPPWRDVAQLNLFNPDTRSALAGELRRVAALCDGVRCDMAMLILNDVFERTWRAVLRDRWPALRDEFWPAAIADVPGLVLLAEVYWNLEWTLQQQGFHYTYDKQLLDRLHAASADDVRGHLSAEPEFSERLVRFLENHDEERSAVALRQRMPAAAVVAGTVPGMRFYFDGQLEGRRVRTPVQLARWVDEPADPEIEQLYARLLEFASADLFQEGEWMLLDVRDAGDGTARDLIAYRWKLGRELALIVANLGAGVSWGRVAVAQDLSPSGGFNFFDALSGTTYSRAMTDRADGLVVRLDPGAAHLFFVRPASAAGAA
jgi:hypothetical protein